MDNKEIKIDLFKVIKWTKNKENLFFSLFGNDVKNNSKNKSLRPIIIVSECDKYFYYLKLRNAQLRMFSEKKNMHNIEILIPSCVDSLLPSTDSYIDCNQIFKIKKEDFIEIIDVQHDDYLNTKVLPKEKQHEIMSTLFTILSSKQPDISFVEIIYNRYLYKTFAKTIYASESMMNKEKTNINHKRKNKLMSNIKLLHNQWNKQHINEIKRIIEIQYEILFNKGL